MTRFILILATVFIFTPAVHAAEIRLPDNLIGISESTYAQLRSAHCNYDTGCDPIINELKDYIVMRVEHAGELYWINTGDGLPFVNRYLSDGFYHTNKKYYYVGGGVKVRLKKGSAFSSVQNLAKNWKNTVTPISDDDLAKTTIDCDQASQSATEFANCQNDYAAGQAILDRTRGGLLLNVDDYGSLYYVPLNAGDPIKLGKTVKQTSFFSFAKSQAKKADADIISELLTEL